MKAHVIENGIVTNTIEVDSLNVIPNLVEATDGSIGWSYSNGIFTPPEPLPISVPDQVTVVQLKLALLQLGYLDAVETDIPALGRSAQIKWGDSRRPVRRHDELVIAMRDIRLWTDDVVDNIFILAATL